MKIKAIIISLLFILSGSLVFGQLIDRESVSSHIKTGTRPDTGNFGFYLGASLVEIEEMFDEDVDLRGVPLMNFKYYYTNNIEIRLGIQMYKLSEKFEGTLMSNEIGLEDNVDKETIWRFIPGVNYHFNNINFLDTYMGLGIIIGSEKDEIITNEKYNITGDFYSDHYTKSTFVWGFSFNFGLQAFVADLPFSLGVEFGITGIKHNNLQYEHQTKSSVGGVVTDQTYYTITDNSLLQYESLEYEKFELGADLRFTISYYFRK